jgi:hypothetical protein
VNWIALAALRYVLKPKILVPILEQQDHHQQQQQVDMEQGASTSHQQEGHKRQSCGQQSSRQLQQQLPQQSLPLFNTLVSNPLPVEVVALAHDTEVLLPPNSSFCMSEAHQMQKVVQGEGQAAPIQARQDISDRRVDHWCGII